MFRAETSHIATLQPSATSWRTSSRPMPVPPPVTTAVLPEKSFIGCVPPILRLPIRNLLARLRPERQDAGTRLTSGDKNSAGICASRCRVLRLRVSEFVRSAVMSNRVVRSGKPVLQGSPMIVIAVLLPWLALLINGHVFQAAFCLGLQLTVLGWIPAAIWAVLVVNDDRRQRQYREMLRLLHGR